MGGGSWTSGDWDSFKTRATTDAHGRTKSREEIFARGSMRKDFDPRNIKIRESIDSADHPNSTPIVVALDVTGSMRQIPYNLVAAGLNKMVPTILDRKPVSDPHLMFMAVGDVVFDRAPLQVTQFEADIRIAEQMKDLFLEGGGGSNPCESYNLPWYFLARKTKIDSFDKRGTKGILFTIGDEEPPENLSIYEIKKVFGDEVQTDISSKELLRMVEERYDVFHLIAKEGSNYDDKVSRLWKGLLGERVIPVSDYREIPAVIVSTLEVISGKPKNEVVASWNGGTAVVVRNAVKDLKPTGRMSDSVVKMSSAGGVWRPGLGTK